MQDFPLNVVCVARGPDTARRWREALAACVPQPCVWESPADLPAGQPLDVVLTDAPEAQGPPGVAVVAVGALPGAADATLPADCTPRRLCQTVVLVGHIARLRRSCDEHQRARAEITALAQTDPLTGLPNRRAWDQHLQTRLTHTQQPLWLGVLDLDGFKAVNDQLGMAQGDEVLARAARALAGQLRAGDVVARLGGDEFGLLLSTMSEVNLNRVLDRLRAAVHGQGKPPITASIGYVSTGRAPADPAALFAAAEQAMRKAKRAGGDRVQRG